MAKEVLCVTERLRNGFSAEGRVGLNGQRYLQILRDSDRTPVAGAREILSTETRDGIMEEQAAKHPGRLCDFPYLNVVSTHPNDLPRGLGKKTFRRLIDKYVRSW
jgi:hypothetical protein